jgi:hypothetical protein
VCQVLLRRSWFQIVFDLRLEIGKHYDSLLKLLPNVRVMQKTGAIILRGEIGVFDVYASKVFWHFHGQGMTMGAARIETAERRI